MGVADDLARFEGFGDGNQEPVGAGKVGEAITSSRTALPETTVDVSRL